MELELAKRLNEIDKDLYLSISYDGSLIELGVESSDIGTIYSYGTTDLLEAYNKIEEFIYCLKSPEKFSSLIKSILEEPLEV